MTHKITLTFFVSLVLSLAVFYTVLGWADPTVAPPNNNVAPPINVGAVGQSKAGTIGATQFIDFNNPSYLIDPSQNSFFAGNIGVGTITPSGKLDIVSGSGFSDLPVSTAFGIIGRQRQEGVIDNIGVYGQGVVNSASANSYGGYFVGTYGSNKNKAIGLYATGVDYSAILMGGNVGIGTATPGAKLEVAGQIKITGGTPSAGRVLTSDANGLASWQVASGGGGTVMGGGTDNYVPRFNGTSTLENSVIYQADSGNVGIGTDPGAYRLNVAGDIFATTLSLGSIKFISNQIISGYNADDEDGDIWINASGYLGGITRYRDFRVGNGKGSQVAMFDGSTGYVGIGSILPSYGGYNPSVTHKVTTPTLYSEQVQIGNATGLLKGVGTLNAVQLCIQGDCKGAWPTSTVGPGTINRMSKFITASTIGDSIVSDNGTNLSLTSGVGGYGAGRIQIPSSGDLIGLTLNSTARVWDLISIVSTNPDYFAIRDSTAGAERFVIGESGNVGVGSGTAPAYKLDVAGDTRITGGAGFGGYNPSVTHKVTTPTLYSEQVQIGNAIGLLKGVGTLNAVQLCIQGDCKGAWPSSGTGTIGGSGTDNYIPRFNGTSTLENSSIYQTDAGNVGIGTITPTTNKLEVSGGQLKANNGLTVNGDSFLATTSVSGNLSLYHSAGTASDINIQTQNTGYATFGALLVSPIASNGASSLTLTGRGTGFMSGAIMSQIVMMNTDNVADQTNYALGGWRATNNLNILGTGKSGLAVATPLMLAAGYLTDNSTNANQLYLSTNGNVGIGTNSPAKKLEVVGGPIKATGGLIMETVTADPAGAETGRIWMRTDL
ncbi:MAG: hypothetical protein NTV62_04310 [Candidatus Gribaldobacteria bacterium]|nr:hypothetical protein [Candidatus Gribaldobacteria bacterium]